MALFHLLPIYFNNFFLIKKLVDEVLENTCLEIEKR